MRRKAPVHGSQRYSESPLTCLRLESPRGGSQPCHLDTQRYSVLQRPQSYARTTPVCVVSCDSPAQCVGRMTCRSGGRGGPVCGHGIATPPSSDQRPISHRIHPASLSIACSSSQVRLG